MSEEYLVTRKFIGGFAHGAEIDVPIGTRTWRIPYHNNSMALINVDEPKVMGLGMNFETYILDAAGDFVHESIANDKSKEWLTFELTNSVSDMQLAQGGADFLVFLERELVMKFHKEMNVRIYTMSQKLGIDLNIVKGQYDYILELRKIIDQMKKREVHFSKMFI
jgi:hypothetical protein